MLISTSVFFLFRRIIWISLVTASLTAFIYYSFNIYKGWCEEPIVMNFDDKLADIYEIPFPAVSTCNAQKFNCYILSVASTFMNQWLFDFSNFSSNFLFHSQFGSRSVNIIFNLYFIVSICALLLSTVLELPWNSQLVEFIEKNHRIGEFSGRNWSRNWKLNNNLYFSSYFQVTICLNAKFSMLFVDLQSHLNKYRSGEIDDKR